MFEIEKNIEKPERRYGRKDKYRWATMEVGDSFFVGVDDASETNSALKRLSASGSSYARRHDPTKKFSVRTVEGGVRIWRDV